MLEVDRRRVWRWQRRRDGGGGLEDRSPGGNPIHALLDWEVEAILALAEEWGPQTARIASWPTGAHTSHRCGWRPRRCAVCWPQPM